MLKAYSADHHLPVHLGAVVEPFSQEVTGNISKAIWLLFGAVLGVLLIACVNLSGLQLARAVAHDRTNAVRAALGAGRIRLFQASLMESLLLAVIGGCAGIGVAFVGIHAFQAIAPANLPRLQQIAINWPVLDFACGLSLLTAVLSGIFPALRSLRTDPQRALQASSARLVNTRQAALARRLLVTLEIACTVILLLVTGLMLRSFSRVLYENHAFNASRVAIAEVDLLNPRYQDSNSSGASARSSFVDRTLERLRANPGVEIAAITSHMPLTGDTNIYSMYRPDHPLPESELPQTNLRNVSPGYFSAMQTPLVAGVNFTESERDHPVDAIISQRAAQLTWPDGQALGRKFRINGRVYSVIGIAADARIANIKENVPVVYLPYWHDPSTTVFFLVRSSQAFESLAPAIRREIWDVDPEAAIPVIKPLDTQIAESVAPDRLQAIVLTCIRGRCVDAGNPGSLWSPGLLRFAQDSGVRNPDCGWVEPALFDSPRPGGSLEACNSRPCARRSAVHRSHTRHSQPAVRDECGGAWAHRRQPQFTSGSHLPRRIPAGVSGIEDRPDARIAPGMIFAA